MFSFSIPIKRVLHNFAANAFGQAMNGVYQLISLPLFLHYWNKEGYGEWLVLFSIPSLLWSLEGGLAGVASNRMTVAASAGNWELANSLFQNVLLIQGILSGILIAGAIAVASTLKLGSYFHFTQTNNSDTATIVLLLICYMLAGFCLSLLRAAYRASENEARGVMANNLWRMAEFCVVAAVLTTHGDTGFSSEVHSWLRRRFHSCRLCRRTENLPTYCLRNSARIVGPNEEHLYRWVAFVVKSSCRSLASTGFSSDHQSCPWCFLCCYLRHDSDGQPDGSALYSSRNSGLCARSIKELRPQRLARLYPFAENHADLRRFRRSHHFVAADNLRSMDDRPMDRWESYYWPASDVALCGQHRAAGRVHGSRGGFGLQQYASSV